VLFLLLCFFALPEALRPPPNPPLPLFYRALPSPQSPPPAFLYLNSSYISWGWQVSLFANWPSLEN
jgi:hypothetical protein